MPRYQAALIRNADGEPGGVSLPRAQRFIALMQDLADEALLARADEIVAETAGVADDPAEPRTFDELVGNVAEGSVTRRPVLTGVEAFTAIVRGGKAPAFAAVMVHAVEPDGTVRNVSEAEAAGDDFPTAPFAEAWAPFYEASAALTNGLLHTQTGTASSSTEATPTTA